MQKSENKVIKVRNNNPIIFTIILIILFIISVSYIAFFSNNNKHGLEGGNNSANVKNAVPQSINKLDQSNNLLVNRLFSKFADDKQMQPGVEFGKKSNDGLTNFIKKEDEAVILDDKGIAEDDKLKNGKLENENILLSQFSSQPKQAVDNYRNYLYNVNLLVSKFLQDSDYTGQIYQIETIKLPQEITNILIDLTNYNQKILSDNDENIIKIFPQTNCWIKKFIKIEKKSSTIKDKEMLKSKIIAKLDFFINFFYSEKLQQEFVK
jgi:hypothetical protein